MFASYVFENSSAEYTDKLFLIDTDNLNDAVCYSDYFAAHGFQIVRYEDDLQFRVEHDEAIYGIGKYAIVAAAGSYISKVLFEQGLRLPNLRCRTVL